MSHLPRSRQKEIVVQELEEEVLVYDLRINKAFCLNQTAGLVFQLSDGSRSITQISDLLSQKLKTPANEELVELALNDLQRNDLLEETQPNYLPGRTRRELIKKVGLASLIALPLISSVIAPPAVMAQSTTGTLLSPCSPTSTCNPGLTCLVCSDGSCGFDQSTRCCANSGIEGSGPGTSFGCTPALSCVNTSGSSLPALCCSNAVTFTPSAICPSPGSGICTCS